MEFLNHSNWIEREYSKIARKDSILAWNEAKMYKDVPMDVGYILMVHKILMKNIHPSIAGKIRETPIYVGRREGLKPDLVEKGLEDWTKEYQKPRKDLEIKEAHIQFEKIHPFEDGNGRVGRILMNIQRINAGLPLLVIHKGEEQFDYYDWVKGGRK